MKQIPLTQGKFALVDDEDFERLNKYKWCAIKQGKTYYAIRPIRFIHKKQRQFNIRMHRNILGFKYEDKIFTDHIDRNGLNNQKSNLRKCTHAENSRNRINTSGKLKKPGVGFNKKIKKYVILFELYNRSIYGGSYKKLKDAVKYRNCMARILHGEFAYII